MSQCIDELIADMDGANHSTTFETTVAFLLKIFLCLKQIDTDKMTSVYMQCN